MARLVAYRAAPEPVCMYAGGGATKQFRDNVAVSDASGAGMSCNHVYARTRTFIFIISMASRPSSV
jgi:hypothetical protein